MQLSTARVSRLGGDTQQLKDVYEIFKHLLEVLDELTAEKDQNGLHNCNIR